LARFIRTEHPPSPEGEGGALAPDGVIPVQDKTHTTRRISNGS
jgi:hypothetical protein